MAPNRLAFRPCTHQPCLQLVAMRMQGSKLLLRPVQAEEALMPRGQTMQVLTLYRAPAPSASMMVWNAPSMLRYFLGSTASRVRMVSSGNMASVDVSPA